MGRMKKKEIVKETVKNAIVLEDIFDFTKAGYAKPHMQESKPYYTKVLRGIKNAKGRVVLMSPKDFLDNSYAITDVASEKIRVPAMLDFPPKKPFPLPYIDITLKKGMGRGRIRLCLENKLDKIPVLLVGQNDNEIDTWIKDSELKVKNYGNK